MILGLGNPGTEYSLNRHNIGFHVLDRLAESSKGNFRRPIFARYSMLPIAEESGKLYLVKPLTYMNNSGAVLSSIFRKTGMGLESLLVICDHLDLPAGICRLKRRGSSGGHRGLQSIISEIGSEDFLRLYIGIGRPNGDTPVPEYVLGNPSIHEKAVLDSGVSRAAAAVMELQTSQPEQVMNELNRKE